MLLAVLLLNAREVVSTDRLIDDIWGGEAPPTAAASVQNSISKLRKTLGADVVQTRSPGYALEVDDDSIDIRRFERLLQDARRLAAAERAAVLREALGLWRGPALAEFAFEPFAQSEIARLEELRLVTVEDRIEAELELGLHDELVGELEAHAVRHSSRERLRELQMLALYRAGRQTEALRVFQDARVALIEELGIEPGERLRALERMILAHDPALDLPAAALATRAVPERRTRKTVAVLLAQIEQAADLDPEAAQAAVATRLAGAAEVVERHGGRLQQLLGDEVVAVFGAVRAHEDDALRALRAASEIRESVEGDGFGVRIGVEAGEMLVGDGAVGLTGGAVTAARRLEARAEAGEILLGPAALRLAAGAVEIVSPETGVYRLLRVVEGAPTVARRLGAPLAGRRDELARLRAALDDAVEGARCVRVAVVGEPGTGKTRLAAELLATLDEDVLALTGRGVPYGEGATYLPLRDALGELLPSVEALLAGEDDAALVAGRLAGLLTSEQGSHPSSDVAWAVRRLVESLARDRPVVLVLDDVHWAEPTLLDLVDYVAEWSADAPIVLVCLGRPELLEDRPEWADGAVVLTPLAEQDARALVDALPERASVDEDAIEAVLAVAEGNPLFLEQLTVYAAEADLREGTVPPTVETLLASRLDRLDLPQRALLEWAAVVGREFASGAVEELAPADQRESVASTLLELVRRRLVRPERSAVPGEDAFSFQHVLVRDVAYASIPKATRAELHERLARWLDARPGALDEIIGFHLEQAHRLRVELGDEDRALAHDAATRLGDAGKRAIGRLDESAAIGLLDRATSLLTESDEQRLHLEVELAFAIKNAGDLATASERLSRCAEIAVERNDRRAELRARIELAWPLLATGAASVDDVLAVVRDARAVFTEGVPDHRALARVYHVEAAANSLLLRWTDVERAAVESNAHYRSANLPFGCATFLSGSWVTGPTPVPIGLARCLELLEEGTLARSLRPYIECDLALLHAMAGDVDHARELIRSAEGSFLEYGQNAAVATVWPRSAATAELAAGDLDAAASVLGRALDDLDRSENPAWFATQAAALADVLARRGDTEEGLRLADEARVFAPRDDLLPQTMWRQARARALADLNRLDEAETMVVEAVALLRQTDAISYQAEVELLHADVLSRQGRSADSVLAADRGRALLESKGHVVRWAPVRPDGAGEPDSRAPQARV